MDLLGSSYFSAGEGEGVNFRSGVGCGMGLDGGGNFFIVPTVTSQLLCSNKIRISNTLLLLSQYIKCSGSMWCIKCHPANSSLSVLNFAPCSIIENFLGNQMLDDCFPRVH